MTSYIRPGQRWTTVFESKGNTTDMNGDVHDYSKAYSKHNHDVEASQEAGRITPAIQVNGVDLHKANGDVKQANGSVRHRPSNTPNGDLIHLLKRERDMNRVSGAGNSKTNVANVLDNTDSEGISREQHHMQSHVGVGRSERDRTHVSEHGPVEEPSTETGITEYVGPRKVDKGKALMSMKELDGETGIADVGGPRKVEKGKALMSMKEQDCETGITDDMGQGKVDKGKALMSNLGTPKGKSGRPNGSVTFAEDVGREPERREFPSPGTSRNSSFRNVVRRHFGKDRLFYLVQSLLSSVEEEKSAHHDLINSFETARQIQVPVCVHAPFDQPEPSPARHKRVRRRSEVLLADKIKLDRIASRNNSLTGAEELDGIRESNEANSEPNECVDKEAVQTDCEFVSDIQNKLAHVAVNEEKCDLKQQHIDQENSERDIRKEADEDNRPNSEASIPRKEQLNSETTSVKSKTVDRANSYEEESNFGNIADKECDPQIKSDSSTHGDETSDSYLDEIPDETKELDQLILESVLINSPSEDSDSGDNTSRGRDLGEVVVIALESSSESDDDDETGVGGNRQLEVYYLQHQEEPFGYCTGECVIEIVGESGTMDQSSDEEDSFNRVEIEDLGDDESDSDLRYLNEKVACISTVEYERRKRRNKLRPTLGSIKEAEASSGSFKSIQARSPSSSGKPEVHQRATSPIINGYSGDSDSDSDIPVYRNKPKPAEEMKSEKQTNSNEITSEVNVVFVTRDDDTMYDARDDVHEDNTSYVRQNNNHSKDIMINGRDGDSIDSSDNESVPSSRGDKSVNTITHDDKHTDNVPKTPTKRPKSRKSGKQTRSSPKPSKIISIDLIDVYNDNRDLQRVDTSDGVPRTRKRTQNTSPRTKSPRAKITKHAKHKKTDNAPLPPKPYPSSPKQVRAVSCPPIRPELDPDSVRRTQVVQYYRSYQHRKDSSRYEQPDFILWNRLDLSSRCKSAVEHYRGGREVVVDRVGENEGGRAGALLQQREREEPNTFKVWDMPITEAVKRVKSGVKNVPKPRDMEDTTPRHVRVQQMYAHLKKIRRSAGYTTCKPLVSMTRRPSDFRP